MKYKILLNSNEFGKAGECWLLRLVKLRKKKKREERKKVDKEEPQIKLVNVNRRKKPGELSEGRNRS